MINLMPPDLKDTYRYARRNFTLIKWGSGILGAIAGVGVIIGVTLIAINTSIDSYHTKTANLNSALVSEDVSGTEKQVTDMSNNLKLMVSILSKEVLFSKLLTRLGNITPPRVILTGLSITQSESAIDITAQAGNYGAAAQLQTNLSDPTNQIFSKADIVNISCATGTAVVNANYPCAIEIRALFTANNPFLFINSGAKK